MAKNEAINTLLVQLNKYIQILEKIKNNSPSTYAQVASSETLPAQFSLDYMMALNLQLIRYFEKLQKIDHTETLQVVAGLIAQSNNKNIGMMIPELLQKLHDNEAQILAPLKKEVHSRKTVVSVLDWIEIALLVSTLILATAFVFFPIIPALMIAAIATWATAMLSSISALAVGLFSVEPAEKNARFLIRNSLPPVPSHSEQWEFSRTGFGKKDDDKITVENTVKLKTSTQHLAHSFFNLKDAQRDKTLCEEAQEQFERLQPAS